MTLQHPPKLIVTPIDVALRGHVSWDKESLVVSASVVREATAPANLAGHIDSTLIQAEAEHRLMVGDLDLLLDRQGRFTSLEIRVGRSASWHAVRLPPMVNVQGPVDIAFDTVFDDNGIAVLETNVTVSFDSVTSEFGFRIQGTASTNYFKLSDDIHFGTDGHGRLTEIRIRSVPIAKA